MSKKELADKREFYERMIIHAIHNQLYQHGHKEFKGDYNCNNDIETQAKIILDSMLETLNN